MDPGGDPEGGTPVVKPSPTGLDRVVATDARITIGLLTSLAFLVSIDSRMIAPLLPAIAASLQTSVAGAGLMVSAYALPYGIFQIGYGPLADRFGKIAVVRIAVLFFGVGTFGCGLAANLPTLTLLRIVTGAFAASVFPMTLAYIGDVVPMRQRQGAIGNLVTITSLATALSPAAGGLIASMLDWRDLFLVCGIATLAPTLLLFRVTSSPARPARAAGWGGLFAPFGVVLRSRKALAIDVLVFVEGGLTSGITYLGAYLHDDYRTGYARIGLLLGLYGVGTLATARVIGRLARRYQSSRLVLVGAALMGVAYLALFGPREQAWFAVAILGMGSGFMLCHSTLQTRITEAVPELRATAVALFAFSLFMGQGAGTAALGFLLNRFGYQAILVACGAGFLLFAMAGAVVVATMIEDRLA